MGKSTMGGIIGSAALCLSLPLIHYAPAAPARNTAAAVAYTGSSEGYNKGMQRPTSSEHSPAFQKYIDRVPGGDILALLDTQIGETRALITSIPESEGGHRYAPGKWSIREVIGHLSDAERIFAYRALRFARADATPLSGFDENTYIAPGGFDRRTLADLMDEYAAVRTATLTLFRGLDADAWNRSGDANRSLTSVRALAWIIAGHERHHVSILRERYLPTSSR